eukprot:14752729-Alexandrium_andersonii.AAC.1
MMVTCRRSGSTSNPAAPGRCHECNCYFRHRDDREERMFNRLPSAFQHLAAARVRGIAEGDPHGTYMKR